MAQDDDDVSSVVVLNGQYTQIRILDSMHKEHIVTLDFNKMVDLVRILADRLGSMQIPGVK